ncbi:MAG: alpha-L-arabinofuranosidase C-terminal domain-containing protein [Bacteroidota bacterium]
MGWIEPNSVRYSLNGDSGFGTIITNKDNAANRNYLSIKVNNPERYILINEGFRGIGVKANAKYELSLKAAQQAGNISKIIFQLVTEEETIVGETSIVPNSSAWKTYESTITSSTTTAKTQLKITFEGKGTIDLDMISLFPQDTWKGRKKGLRKDLVQLLADLKPGFLRFPGGCVVEGRTLARRYQWKKTVGNLEERELLINRWNTEFSHRSAPDYYQSFGLGFFEYFQLSEDIGATPLPILGCGMACQFNTGELAPMDELEPYVQDAIDLIEFANGDTNTKWGKLRADMGHPQPFNMKYIGIGNEQWGEAYIERYAVFEKAIKEKYPDIVIVSTSGPFPDGDMFEYGWEQLKKMNAEIVDEHYYRSPQWFLENADRYDNYDRNGPKVFAGEYAAHPKGVEDGSTENNWESALAEAAFMTGLERNADIVTLTSYAPLMAHAEGWQWAPDMIWFDNLNSYGTANYYVQKMYSNHAGTDLLKITKNGQALAGQNGLYASAVKDKNTGELYVKIANTKNDRQKIVIKIDNVKLATEASVLTMASDDLKAINSFDTPMKLSPVESKLVVKKGIIEAEMPSNAFVIYKVKMQ